MTLPPNLFQNLRKFAKDPVNVTLNIQTEIIVIHMLTVFLLRSAF